jgi:hypothetical protein
MAEWLFKSSVLTYSGGTAPDSHRTSLLCPSWAPKQGLNDNPNLPAHAILFLSVQPCSCSNAAAVHEEPLAAREDVTTGCQSGIRRSDCYDTDFGSSLVGGII